MTENQDTGGRVENTSTRDPLLHFAGLLGGSDDYITGMESAGQAQLVNSTMLPTEINGGTEQDIAALGIELGPVDSADALFRPATLPDGWSKQASDHAMWSYIVDQLGRNRVRVFYKAAFYDRKASMSISTVDSYASEVVDGAPLVLDDEWATAEAVRSALVRQRAYADEATGKYDTDGYWAGQVAAVDRVLAQLPGGDR